MRTRMWFGPLGMAVALGCLGGLPCGLLPGAGTARGETRAAPPEGKPEAVVNVKDHGATGDGVTDDAAAVRAAFAAAPAGSRLYFPAGTYFFPNGGVVLKDRAGLIVTGDPTAVLKAGGGRSKLILSFETCSDITVTGLKFDLNGVTHFGPGLAFVNARRIRVHANHFFDGNYQPKMTADRYALVFRLTDSGNEDIWITDNLIEHLQVEIDTARRVHVVNNRSIAPELACGFGSFTLKKNSFVEDIEFVGNYIEDPQAYAICVAGDGERDGASMRRVRIANNTVVCRKRAPMLAAIAVGTRAEKQEVQKALWEGITIANNRIWYGPKINKRHWETGIRVACAQQGETLTRVRITGNTIVDESGIANFGIETRQLRDAVISDNAVYGTRAGVLLAGGWTRTLVQGNRVSDVAGPAYQLEESGGENRFHNNFVYGKAGTPYAASGLQPTDSVDTASPPVPAPPRPAAPTPAAEVPGKGDVTRDMIGIADAKGKAGGEARAVEEPFDSTNNVQALRGYQAAATQLTLVKDDKKEGDASVKTTWTSTSGGGTGGVEKKLEPTDLTRRTFSVWVKPLTPEAVLANASIALYDADKQRAQVWFWFPHRVRGWTKLTFAPGQKGDADNGGEVKGDITRITGIRFSGTTRGARQTCELLWDRFQEVKPNP